MLSVFNTVIDIVAIKRDFILYFIELLHQTWNIFAVSILFDFYRDEVHLKKYAKRIKEEVASTLTSEDVTYDATVSIMEDVTRPSPSDPLPLQVFSTIINKIHTIIMKKIHTIINFTW